MKTQSIFFATVLLQLVTLNSFSQCNTAWSSAFSGTYSNLTISSANAYLAPAAILSVSDTLRITGSNFCNQGTITAKVIVVDSSNIYNYGSITSSTTLSLSDNNLFNYTPGIISIGNDATINGTNSINSSQITVQGALHASGSNITTQTGGTTFICGNVNADSSNIINYGVLEILARLTSDSGNVLNNINTAVFKAGDFVLSGSVFRNHGSATIADSLYNAEGVIEVQLGNIFSGNLINGSVIIGHASSYGRIQISGSSQNISPNGVVSNLVDICDLGNPTGGWDINTGIVGMNVTYCVNNGTGLQQPFNTCQTPTFINNLSFQGIDLFVFPNPSNGVFVIKTPHEIFHPLVVEVYTALGEKIITMKIDGTSIDLSALPSGVYVLQIISQEGVTHFKKLIKE